MLSNMLICLFPNTALHISKDKPLPCVHVTTGNTKALHNCLVITFKEAQKLLLKFPSSMSLRTVETCFIAQFQPSGFRNLQQLKSVDFSSMYV